MSDAVGGVPAGCVLGCILRSLVVHSLWTTSVDGGDGEDEQSREGLHRRGSRSCGGRRRPPQPATTEVPGTLWESYGSVTDASGGEELARAC
jgi:hypothetical protein